MMAIAALFVGLVAYNSIQVDTTKPEIPTVTTPYVYTASDYPGEMPSQ